MSNLNYTKLVYMLKCQLKIYLLGEQFNLCFGHRTGPTHYSLQRGNISQQRGPSPNGQRHKAVPVYSTLIHMSCTIHVFTLGYYTVNNPTPLRDKPNCSYECISLHGNDHM